MSIKKLEDGRYIVDMRLNGGKGKRVRRKFEKRSQALAFEREILASSPSPDCFGNLIDKRHLSDFIAIWWRLIGRHKDYANRRLSNLRCICLDMGDPMMCEIDERMIADYRSRRLDSGIKASTINHDLFALSAVLKAMTEIGEYHGGNPVLALPRLKEKAPEMSYLTTEEIERFLSICGDKIDYYRMAVLLLSTGARWNEAYQLMAEHIVGNKVVFNFTKNGKRRVVPVSDDVVRLVKNRNEGRLFRVSYKWFRLKLKEAKPNLPDGQAVHVLRHTFATHFMMNGGNIVSLQRILGHADISQTMTYAHFSPEYLEDAVLHNPLQRMPLECPNFERKRKN
ncbi:TPA: tyrosine-type recombinase/integrase [Escherichia coli]|uniref:phage integrase n=1 Tax=Enterobacteriaceae TaxID=543 RepID=UPI0004DB1BEB|nr:MULTISPECIES: tyrosine-type recombinase/integrase [Enterobacteriaceae]ANP31519.1 integrase [Escherichia coli]EFA6232559.1 integrase [Escherichia coli]EFB1943138.1 integrase [Escherichia coli]EFH0949342.1 tyrosine-type recombinase/integrase [Escherichia coli]EFN7490732.1 integrase [Escherichia coli]